MNQQHEYPSYSTPLLSPPSVHLSSAVASTLASATTNEQDAAHKEKAPLEIKSATTSHPQPPCSTTYNHLPQVTRITWNDEFFASIPSAIAVFDLDEDTASVTPSTYLTWAHWRLHHLALTSASILLVYSCSFCVDERVWKDSAPPPGRLLYEYISYESIVDCEVNVQGQVVLQLEHDVQSSFWFDNQRTERTLNGLVNPKSFDEALVALQEYYHRQNDQGCVTVKTIIAEKRHVDTGNDNPHDTLGTSSVEHDRADVLDHNWLEDVDDMAQEAALQQGRKDGSAAGAEAGFQRGQGLGRGQGLEYGLELGFVQGVVEQVAHDLDNNDSEARNTKIRKTIQELQQALHSFPTPQQLFDNDDDNDDDKDGGQRNRDGERENVRQVLQRIRTHFKLLLVQLGLPHQQVNLPYLLQTPAQHHPEAANAGDTDW